MPWPTTICLATLVLLPCPALALAWNADGVPVSRAPGSQTNPVIVLDGSGGAFVAYQYVHATLLKGANQTRTHIRRTFRKVDSSIIFRNLPPAFILKCVK